MNSGNEIGIVYPQVAIPGALAIAATSANVERLRLLQSARRILYRLKAVAGKYIPLTGSVEDIVALASKTDLRINEPPLSMYLHHGGRNAVFFDLHAHADGTLSSIEVEVEAETPEDALAGGRSAVNELLDVMMRRLWLPLVLVRLDLSVGSETQPVAHELHVPFVGGLSIGPLGGIHQYPLFSELESLAREGICSTSPYYRLLCSYRLYEGSAALRKKLRQLCQKHSVNEPLPKDPQVDTDLLVAMGLGGMANSGMRTVSDLHSKLKEMRNMVAHFLLTGGQEMPPLHTSDGLSYRVFSSAAAALLHYGITALQELASFFQRHLASKVLLGSVLPMTEHREHYRVVVRSGQPTLRKGFDS